MQTVFLIDKNLSTAFEYYYPLSRTARF